MATEVIGQKSTDPLGSDCNNSVHTQIELLWRKVENIKSGIKRSGRQDIGMIVKK